MKVANGDIYVVLSSHLVFVFNKVCLYKIVLLSAASERREIHAVFTATVKHTISIRSAYKMLVTRCCQNWQAVI